MSNSNYKSHISESCFGKGFNQESAIEGMVGSLVNRATAVNQYQQSENKWKREINILLKNAI